MSSFLSSLPAVIVVLAVIAFLIFTGMRVGVRFLIRRLAGLVFVLIGVTFITFIMGYFAPGDAVLTQLGQRYTPERAAALRHVLGLDLPWYQQYFHFVVQLLHLSLGNSYVDNQPAVLTVLSRDLPASMQLGMTGIVLAVVVGVPLGLLAAVRTNTRYDTTAQVLGLILYAVPSFVIIPFFQILMIKLYQAGLPSLPVSGWGSLDTEIAPITIFGLGAFAYYLRITRASMLEVLNQDYVRTARAKGLPERVVLWRHAFRNAMIPLVTAIGPALAFAVSGVFVVELLFNIPGIGTDALTAVVERDFPVVQGAVIILALAVVFLNLVTDVVYGLIDPRIKTQ
ncbi:MAG TPA: ABC transporter permease [Ktedonobacterales bacterium]|jgi:ABC-type dipeptide/oligopeptide/nickel transport system permease component|nr:ABC transporter permease [Ktedonobacterales bacterium]